MRSFNNASTAKRSNGVNGIAYEATGEKGSSIMPSWAGPTRKRPRSDSSEQQTWGLATFTERHRLNRALGFSLDTSEPPPFESDPLEGEGQWRWDGRQWICSWHPQGSWLRERVGGKMRWVWTEAPGCWEWQSDKEYWRWAWAATPTRKVWEAAEDGAGAWVEVSSQGLEGPSAAAASEGFEEDVVNLNDQRHQEPPPLQKEALCAVQEEFVRALAQHLRAHRAADFQAAIAAAQKRIELEKQLHQLIPSSSSGSKTAPKPADFASRADALRKEFVALAPKKGKQPWWLEAALKRLDEAVSVPTRTASKTSQAAAAAAAATAKSADEEFLLAEIEDSSEGSESEMEADDVAVSALAAVTKRQKAASAAVAGGAAVFLPPISAVTLPPAPSDDGARVTANRNAAAANGGRRSSASSAAAAAAAAAAKSSTTATAATAGTPRGSEDDMQVDSEEVEEGGTAETAAPPAQKKEPERSSGSGIGGSKPGSAASKESPVTAAAASAAAAAAAAAAATMSVTLPPPVWSPPIVDEMLLPRSALVTRYGLVDAGLAPLFEHATWTPVVRIAPPFRDLGQETPRAQTLVPPPPLPLQVGPLPPPPPEKWVPLASRLSHVTAEHARALSARAFFEPMAAAAAAAGKRVTAEDVAMDHFYAIAQVDVRFKRVRNEETSFGALLRLGGGRESNGDSSTGAPLADSSAAGPAAAAAAAASQGGGPASSDGATTTASSQAPPSANARRTLADAPLPAAAASEAGKIAAVTIPQPSSAAAAAAAAAAAPATNFLALGASSPPSRQSSGGGGSSGSSDGGSTSGSTSGGGASDAAGAAAAAAAMRTPLRTSPLQNGVAAAPSVSRVRSLTVTVPSPESPENSSAEKNKTFSPFNVHACFA